ncbi:MAG: PRC-barrel domain-containing protein [Acetobacteraceae bacterium]
MDAVLGSQVTTSDGKSIGRLTDVLVDQDGKPKAAVIDVGGFLGVGTRRVAAEWSALRFSPAEQKGRVLIEMTSEQIRAAPPYQDPKKPVPVISPGPPSAGDTPTPQKPD